MNREEIIQLKFEHTIELLIMYKQQNPLKEVYLSEKCISKALKWYQEYMNVFGKNIKA